MEPIHPLRKAIIFILLVLICFLAKNAMASEPSLKMTATTSVVEKAPQKLPNAAEQLLPVLAKEIDTFWPQLFIREFPAGLIEQESNWKVGAALKTKREFGCGLGQFTVAYNADGSVRFNALEETRALHPTLRGWTMADCYNAQFQLRAVVLKLQQNERSCIPLMANKAESLNCAAAKYNGGSGSITRRVRACRMTKDCDPRIWQNLAQFCPQSKQKAEGYGESFCEINSKYPGRVTTRMVKYQGKVNAQ